VKLLIVRIGALGDAIHTLPLVNEIRRLAPETEIHWAAGGGVIRFLGTHPAVNHWVPVGRGVKGLHKAWKDVRGKYDCAIDTQGLTKSAALARAAAPRAIGRGVGYAREWPATWFYTELITPRPGHVIEQNLGLLLPLFPDVIDHPIRYEIPSSTSAADGGQNSGRARSGCGSRP
jgi:heptosyltransferase I